MSPVLLYKILFAVSILTNAGIALVHVGAPHRFAKLVGLEWKPDMLPFARAWGATLLGLHLCYIPALLDPIGMAWITWSSIAIKLVIMPPVFLTNGRGFKLFALWDLGFGIALAIAYVLAIG